MYDMANVIEFYHPEAAASVVWCRCRELLIHAVPDTSYSPWLDPVLPINFENGLLELEVPTTDHMQFLDSQYYEILKDLIDTEMGSGSDIHLQIYVPEVNLEATIESYISMLGKLIYLDARSQRNWESGKNVSAGICIAVHPAGQEVHLEIERLSRSDGEGEREIVDTDVYRSAGAPIRLDGSNFAIIKNLWTDDQFRVPISAITTGGWCLVSSDPWIGEKHWLPGKFFGNEQLRYYLSTKDQGDISRIEVQGYMLSDETVANLQTHGVQVTRSVHCGNKSTI